MLERAIATAGLAVRLSVTREPRLRTRFKISK